MVSSEMLHVMKTSGNREYWSIAIKICPDRSGKKSPYRHFAREIVREEGILNRFL